MSEKLTDTAVRNAKPKAKPYKLPDGKGLYLLVSPAGGKLWRLKYRFAGKEKLLSFGGYPDVSLAEARDRRDEARKKLANKIDPSVARKTQAQAETLEAVAREWHEKSRPSWTPKHAEKIMRFFERDVFPYLGGLPIKQITASEIQAAILRIESRGAIDIARRVLQNCGKVYRFAVATGRAERNPCGDLEARDFLASVKEKHHASLTDPKAVGELLRAIEGYTGSFVTQCALRLAPLVFVRPGELRQAEWSEIDLDKAEWRIPAAKMKMRVQHIVPLSRQALAILKELHPLTGGGRFVFPSERTPARAMSENTINAALRRMGYTKNEQTGHGFRSMASTILHEQGWPSDVIERQLAHGQRDKIKAAYCHA